MTVSATNGVIDLALARIVPWSDLRLGLVGVVDRRRNGRALRCAAILTWITSSGSQSTSRWPRVRAGAARRNARCRKLVVLSERLPLRLSVYPFIVWAALRFRQRETTTAIAIVGGIAIWATTHNLGPWGPDRFDLRLIQLDSWMSVFAFTGLVLGAVTAEKHAASAALDALLEQTKHAVDTLQAAFLPPDLPQRAGLRSDALYIPAEREALIGGDWYDAFELPDGRIVFSIGDVAGHGLDAAVAGERLRRGIFAAAFGAPEPAEILAGVDRNLRFPLEAPVTAIVAIISRDLSEMSYASAGHPPPILAGPNIPAHLLEYGGVPFGAGMAVEAPTHTTTLERGAVVLFYTDGLTEFERDIFRAESAALRAVSLLVDDPKIDRPAAFVQRGVMGLQRPVDDTVLLVVQF